MSYSAPNGLLMPWRHGIDTLGGSWIADINTVSTAGAWPSANLAIFVPLCIPSRVMVRKLVCYVGSGTAGNVDMGLYAADGVEVIAASNAAKESANPQTFDVTDTAIGPGLYYVGLASDSAADTFMRDNPAAPTCAGLGILSQTSAYPLPSSPTWVLDQTLAYIPLVGLLVEATVT